MFIYALVVAKFQLFHLFKCIAWSVDEIALSLALEIANSVNLEAIQSTVITSKIFRPLYLGYN